MEPQGPHEGHEAPAVEGTYFSFLRAMHRHARPRTYVEIGIYKGEALRLAEHSTRVVGIDPRPKIDGDLPARWTVYAETSDEFFATPDHVRSVGTIDVAFVDGLHHFEQALRDFMNLEPLMSANGVVILHDCVPPRESWAGRTSDNRERGWAGDVWKVVPILAEHRPDLRVDLVGATPTGLGIITQLDGASRVLDEHFDEIVARWREAPYAPQAANLGGSWSTASDLFPVFRRANVLDELRQQRDRARYVARRTRRRHGRHKHAAG